MFWDNQWHCNNRSRWGTHSVSGPQSFQGWCCDVYWEGEDSLTNYILQQTRLDVSCIHGSGGVVPPSHALYAHTWKVRKETPKWRAAKRIWNFKSAQARQLRQPITSVSRQLRHICTVDENATSENIHEHYTSTWTGIGSILMLSEGNIKESRHECLAW
jgi:hypothetical protein